MPSRLPKTCRPRWWTELPLIVAVYALYSAGRLVVRGDETAAVAHGLALLRLERPLRLDLETGLNRLFTEHAWLGVPADFAYAALHYLVTPALLIWLFRSRAAHYRALRTWLMCSTLLGLTGFVLMPTSPPRLLGSGHGFTDTMAQYAAYGWWGGEASAPRGLGGLTNEFAAMPSLHVGWALWCGAVLWRCGRRSPLVRTLAVGYPLGIAVVVMGTANHYLLDVVAGAAVMGLGLLLTRPVLLVSARLQAVRRRTPAGTVLPVAASPGHVPAVPAVLPGQAAPPGSGAAPVTSAPSVTSAALLNSGAPVTSAASVTSGRAGARIVGAGCKTSGRTAISREATADEHIPRRRDGADERPGERSAPTAH